MKGHTYVEEYYFKVNKQDSMRYFYFKCVVLFILLTDFTNVAHQACKT